MGINCGESAACGKQGEFGPGEMISLLMEIQHSMFSIYCGSVFMTHSLHGEVIFSL